MLHKIKLKKNHIVIWALLFLLNSNPAKALADNYVCIVTNQNSKAISIEEALAKGGLDAPTISLSAFKAEIRTAQAGFTLNLLTESHFNLVLDGVSSPRTSPLFEQFKKKDIPHSRYSQHVKNSEVDFWIFLTVPRALNGTIQKSDNNEDSMSIEILIDKPYRYILSSYDCFNEEKVGRYFGEGFIK